MKTEYYMVNDRTCQLRKFIDDYEYIWHDKSNKWYDMGFSGNQRYDEKKKITEEEAFRYILEH